MPTSVSTVNERAARAISRALSASGIGMTPRETSTSGTPASAAQRRHSSTRPWLHAISSSVPPRQARTPCSASSASFVLELAVEVGGAPPELPDVDELTGRLEQSPCLRRGQALVEHVGQPCRARLGRSRRQAQEVPAPYIG